jgi:drug/metabolite transporter (DMT)-like permease
MSVLFALLSAFSNACTILLQRIANVSSPEGLPGFRHALHLVRQPLWLVGMAFMVATFAFLAIALYFGTLAVVQPLVVTELIFTLALRKLWLRHEIAARSWLAAAVTCGGLAGFLLVAQPRVGQRIPTAGGWAVVLVSRTLVVVVRRSRSGTPTTLSAGSPKPRAAWRDSPSVRASLTGCAAGVVWSVDAGFVKAATEVLHHRGWVGLLGHWPLYALIATGVLGTLLVQASLHVGPLTASQPAMLISDPLASILLGIELFGERLSHGALAVGAQLGLLTVMALGVVLLSEWAPPLIAGSDRAPILGPP